MSQPSTNQQDASSCEHPQCCAASKPECYGGIVLCGGRSRRMGRDKTWLRFGSETMLQRVVRLLGEAVDRLVVVAGVDQQLPPLDGLIRVLRDRQPDRGPLEGIAVGLAALGGSGPGVEDSGPRVPGSPGVTRDDDSAVRARDVCRIRLVFVVGCDMPLLRPALVRRMLELAAGCDVLAPAMQDHYEPLAAVYGVDVLPQIEKLLAAGRRRPIELFPLVRTRLVSADCLRQADPQLQSFFNVNGLADYRTALRLAGLGEDADYDAQLGGRP